jgi:hypothetical protein
VILIARNSLGAEPFSVVIGTQFDPDTHEPGKTRLLMLSATPGWKT